MGQERNTWSPPRESPRYALDQRLIVKTEGGKLHGRTKDISEKGLGATVAGELSLYESVELEFYLPGSLTPVKIHAEARYRQGFQYGFCFLGITERQKGLIEKAALHLKLVP
jgi:hypothetical protein